MGPVTDRRSTSSLRPTWTGWRTRPPTRTGRSAPAARSPTGPPARRSRSTRNGDEGSGPVTAGPLVVSRLRRGLQQFELQAVRITHECDLRAGHWPLRDLERRGWHRESVVLESGHRLANLRHLEAGVHAADVVVVQVRRTARRSILDELQDRIADGQERDLEVGVADLEHLGDRRACHFGDERGLEAEDLPIEVERVVEARDGGADMVDAAQPHCARRVDSLFLDFHCPRPLACGADARFVYRKELGQLQLGRVVQVEPREIEHTLLEPEVELVLRLDELRERRFEVVALDVDDRGAAAVHRRAPRDFLRDPESLLGVVVLVVPRLDVAVEVPQCLLLPGLERDNEAGVIHRSSFVASRGRPYYGWYCWSSAVTVPERVTIRSQ